MTVNPRIITACLFGIAASAIPGAALPQGGSAAGSGAAKADFAYDAARAAFEALPESDRKAVQDALVWTGDYNASAGGTFGRRSYDAIVAYQRRAKLGPSGILDGKQRDDLVAAGARAREAAKFAATVDPNTGVEIGVPERILGKRSVNPQGGARWQSADGKITLDTRAIPAGETDLSALYERHLAIQTPGRQVTYKLLRPDFFVVSGESRTGKFYTRYAVGAEGLRGFSIGYDKSVAKNFDRVLIAVANSFTPFPRGQTAAAASPPAAPTRTAPTPAAAPFATGLVVAPGRVLTSAIVESCPDLRVAGRPAQLLDSDKANGLALVRAEREPALPTLLLAASAAQDEAVVVLSFAAPGPERTLVATPASLGVGQLTGPLQPGASGAPGFDRRGALAVLAGAFPARPRMIAGTVPAMSYPAVPAAALAAFLEEKGIAAQPAADGPPRSVGDLATIFGAAIVIIECGP